VLSTRATHAVYNIAGVAIAVANTNYGTHAGVIFGDHILKRLLHLKWHYDLAAEDVPREWGWLEIDIPQQLSNVVSTICRNLWNNYGPTPAEKRGLPFAINSIAAIDAGGFVQNCSTGWGFTCSTMVLGIFDGANVELVDKAGWYVRPEDTEWQAKIIASLARSGAPEEFIEAQRKDLGHSFRYRPADIVAAGSRVTIRPSTLMQIAELSNDVAREIEALPIYGRGY
jgi:hypothetical protein